MYIPTDELIDLVEQEKLKERTYMDLLRDIKVIFLGDNSYNELLDTIKNAGCHVPDLKSNLAFAIDSTVPMIVFKEVVKDLSEDEQRAIIAHEVAHLVGIKDEEDADRWAVSALTTESEKDVLRNQWEYRHGCEYEE